MILEVLDRVKEEGFLTVYLDLFKVTSEEAFIAAYAREIARLQGGGIRSMLRRVKELLPRLIPKVVMKGEEEILEKVDGGYQYTDVFFKRWVREEFT